MKNEIIFVTGGAGSFSNTFVHMTLAKYNPKKIIAFSRYEMKQWDMAKKFEIDERGSFLIGNFRCKNRLHLAFDGADYMVKCTETNILFKAGYKPFKYVVLSSRVARNIEKYFTLDRNYGGPVDSFFSKHSDLSALWLDKRTWECLGKVSYRIESSELGNSPIRRNSYFASFLKVEEEINQGSISSVGTGFGLQHAKIKHTYVNSHNFH